MADTEVVRATAAPQPAGGLRPEPQASQPIGAHQAHGLNALVWVLLAYVTGMLTVIAIIWKGWI